MKIRIEKDDINNDIYFLDNANKFKDEQNIEHLKELNESNTELYINEKKMKYKKFFRPEKEGIYLIKLKIKGQIKDCSFMFGGCDTIINIDLTNFNTKNATNMSGMFYHCYSLNSIDVSNSSMYLHTIVEKRPMPVIERQ